MKLQVRKSRVGGTCLNRAVCFGYHALVELAKKAREGRLLKIGVNAADVRLTSTLLELAGANDTPTRGGIETDACKAKELTYYMASR